MAEHDYSREKYVEDGDYVTVDKEETFGSIVCHTPRSSASARHWPARRARIVACVNALEGYNPDAVRDVVELSEKMGMFAYEAMRAFPELDSEQNRAELAKFKDALARLGGAS